MKKNERIELLREDLLKEQLSIPDIFIKHIIQKESFLFANVFKDLEMEKNLKQIIAEAFGVEKNQILIVGSSMLGFSLNPKKLFQDFDHDFKITGKQKDKSDIDIAIVSHQLFNELNRRLYMFTKSFRNKWFKNEYYYEERLQQFDVALNYKFFEYHTKGWFRPDMKPIGFEFCSTGSYEQLKSKVIKLTQRRPGIAIYKESFYFESYHLENLKRIQNLMKKDIL